MIKIVSFFVFVAAFIWTWSLMSSKDAVGIDVHAGIQSKMALLIEETIKAKRPNSSNFQLQSIYTEKMDDNKIKAYFSYKFTDAMEENEQSTQVITGQAVLNRTLSEDAEVQKWVIQSVKTNASQLEFREGLVISSDGNETPVEETPATETPAAAAPTTTTPEKKTN